MITAPMLQQGVDVNLPKATTAPLEGNSEQVVISIRKSGEVYIGAGNVIALPDLGAKVKAIMATRKPEDQKIYINADTDLPYGRIMDVMGRLHQAGIYQIGLVSSPEGGRGDEEKTKEPSGKKGP